MLKTRVIPTLLLSGYGLVKGQKFRDHRYIGDPINAVKIFNDKEVDELVFLDISATKEGKGPNFEILKDIASQVFMPFGYGGGISSLSDIEKLFKIGVEKVIINTQAINDINFIKEASKVVGAQSIVVSIDVKKSFLGQYLIFSKSGSKKMTLNLEEYIKAVEDAGAGEILLCSLDREGTSSGLDYELIQKVSNNISIPLVASGGTSCLEDIKKAARFGASGVAVGDMFVFYGKHKAVLITYPEYDELENLFRG